MKGLMKSYIEYSLSENFKEARYTHVLLQHFHR